jgi:2'-5' RNA ligase
MKKIFVYSQPPKEISNDIKKKIKEIEKVFGRNKVSLNSPHLTLSNGFKVSEKELGKFCKILKKEFDKLKKPLIKICGWESYAKGEIYCIQLRIEKNDSLISFHKEIRKLIRKYEQTFVLDKFNPHISLAWNMKANMKKEKFEEVINYLKEQNFKFDKKYLLDKIYIGKTNKNKFELIKTIK